MKTLALATVIAPLALTALAAMPTVPGQEIDPVRWLLSAKPLDKVLQRGDRVQAIVTAQVENGWHLYSTTATTGGPEPTTIILQPGTPFEVAGPIVSPPAVTEPDANFGRDVSFYEGTVTFTIPLRYRVAAAAAKVAINVKVRFQACNDKLCLAPRTKDLQLALAPPAKGR